MRAYLLSLVFLLMCLQIKTQNNRSVSSAINSSDSLEPFNEDALRSDLLNKGLSGTELTNHLTFIKKQSLANKSHIAEPKSYSKDITNINHNSNPFYSNNNLNLNCNNWDFENVAIGSYTSANAIPDWTISSQTAMSCTASLWSAGSNEFSVVATPVFGVPLIGILPHSPLGGTQVLRLNDTISNYHLTKIARTITVTANNFKFQFAYAGFWQDGTHSCCEQSKFSVNVFNNGIPLVCASGSLFASSTGCPNTFSASTYDVQHLLRWNNWQVETIDLSLYIGSILDIEITCNDCVFGGHYGTLFFDSKCGDDQYEEWNNTNAPISYCGSNQVVITAPPGCTSYSWVPGQGSQTLTPAQSTQSAITIPYVIGAVYYCYFSFNNQCFFYSTNVVTFNPVTQVGLAYIGASSSCFLGSSGSATVVGAGSSVGYNYLWLDANSVLVGTTSVVNNLSPGIYSVTLSAPNTPSCGVYTGTTLVQVNNGNISYSIQPYCGTQAYLSAGAGSNFQWYDALTAIPVNQGGSAASYTVSAPVNNSIYWLSYLSNQSCKDSVQFLILNVNSGSISISTPSICPGSNNGSAFIDLYPTYLSPPLNHAFLVYSASGPGPNYSTGINPTSANSFTANNLTANNNYSVEVFDGACYYSGFFTLNSIIPAFDYSISPNSATLCPGDSFSVTAVFSNPTIAGQFFYSWSPTTFLSPNTSSLQSTVITPTAAVGSSLNIFYSLLVTPTLANCPLVRTLTLTEVNFQTPTLSTTPSLCSNTNTISLVSTPIGGYYLTGISGTNSPIGNTSGVLIPSLAAIGINSYTYALISGTCIAASTATYLVLQAPVLQTELSFTICTGETKSLSVSGADVYYWSNGSTGSVTTLSPNISGSFTVTGINNSNNCSADLVINCIVDVCQGENEINLHKDVFQIYPNPCSGKVNIETRQSIELLIYNEIGQIILKQNLSAGNNSLDLSHYAEGIYFIKIASNSSCKFVQLIKE